MMLRHILDPILQLCNIAATSCPYYTSAQHQAVHASMHACLRHVLFNSTSLVYAETLAFSCTNNNPEEAADCLAKDTVLELQVQNNLVKLMHRLLAVLPLSQRPQAASHEPGHHQHVTSLASDSDSQQPAVAGTEVTAPNDRRSCSSIPASIELGPRLTPKAADWQDIQLVASRACVLLAWTLLPRVMHSTNPEATQAWVMLVPQLLSLIQVLIGGHLWDMHLSMAKVFQCGLHAVLAAHLQVAEDPLRSATSAIDQAQLSALVTAMLSRLAQDSALLPSPAKLKSCSRATQDMSRQVAEMVFTISGETVVTFALLFTISGETVVTFALC